MVNFMSSSAFERNRVNIWQKTYLKVNHKQCKLSLVSIVILSKLKQLTILRQNIHICSRLLFVLLKYKDTTETILLSLRLTSAVSVLHMSSIATGPVLGFPTRPDTNQAVQPRNMDRDLQFLILEVEGLYYLCSRNKDANQLPSYSEADLCLCFRICKPEDQWSCKRSPDILA